MIVYIGLFANNNTTRRRKLHRQVLIMASYKHYEADHINGDHANWTADNLQWVTPAENRRRAKLARCMRKIGLQPKWLYHSILRGLYFLPTEQAELVINRFRFEAGTSDDAITIERINSTFAFLLDELKNQPS